MWGGAVIRTGIVLLLAVLPSYAVERFTEYLFLTSSPDFFTWSGLRVELFISSMLLAAVIAGYLLDGLPVAAAYTSAILILLSLFFVFCRPRVCFNAGPDRLEPLRMGYFFSCLGLVGVSAGNSL